MPDKPVRRIGQVLTRYRVAAGLTVDEVAARMGVRRSQVAKYEADEVNIPDHRMDAFAAVVGVLPADLALECLFHADPDLKGKTTGKLFRQTMAELHEWIAVGQAAKPAGKKPPARKPATRTPPRRRVSR